MLNFAPAKSLLVVICIFIFIPAIYGADDQSSKQWRSVDLWSDKDFSAQVLFPSSVTGADDRVLVLKFINSTGSMRSVIEPTLTLDVTYVDPSTGKEMQKFERSAEFRDFSSPRLPPGVTTVLNDQATAENALIMPLGLPLDHGCLIKIKIDCRARLFSGPFSTEPSYSTPPGGIDIQLAWKPSSPDATMTSALKQLRTLLENPGSPDADTTELDLLTSIPATSNTLTDDDLIAALDRRVNYYTHERAVIARVIARRFISDPKVIAYYHDRISLENAVVLGDLENTQLWNSAWIDPLIANFELRGDGGALNILAAHRADWIANSQDVSRLSAALLRFRPLLSNTTTSIAVSNLRAWSMAASEAGVVGDKRLIRVLRPTLDDKRVPPPLVTAKVTPPNSRVCDDAVSAILTLLDGTPALAFKEANADIWERNDAVRFAAFDRVITRVKERLKTEAHE